MITILSSLAQEESRSISENVKWGMRKSFSEGKVLVPFNRFLGYDRGEDGNLVINEEQAKVVRLIYGLYMSGLSSGAVARELMRRKIPTPAGKEKWCIKTIENILTQEKMKGDALLQKTVSVDFLTKKKVKNQGQAPQYYIEGNHEAIITPEQFDLVQAEIKRRRTSFNKYSGVSIFSSRIKCSDCGGWYGPKIWHSNDKYRRVVWQCNDKFKGAKCTTAHLTEDEIKVAFIKAFNILFTSKAEIIANIKLVQKEICNLATLEDERDRLAEEVQVLTDMANNTIKRNATVAQDQAEYQKNYDALLAKYDTARKAYDEVVEKIQNLTYRRSMLDNFVKELGRQENLLTEFDSGLWGALIDYMTVRKKDDIDVTFKDGTTIHIG